jgi:hypothetical protein
MGALHPVLFFMFIYGISLFLAIFVCRTVYYSVHTEVAEASAAAQQSQLGYTQTATNVTALK